MHNITVKKAYRLQFIAYRLIQKKMSKPKQKPTTPRSEPKQAAPIITTPVVPSAPANADTSLPAVPELALLACCIVLTLLVFANTFNAGFVNWDDQGYLWLNKLVQPISFNSLYAMFTDHICGNYSPLVALTYSIEHAFDPVVKPDAMVAANFRASTYHIDNVLLHAGTAAAVFFLMRHLGVRGWGLALATALFAVHPLRTESVAWVTERKDVLYGVFYILALINYWKYITQTERKTLNFSLVVVFGLLSLFAKIQAVSLPLSMLCLDYYANRDLKSMGVWIEKLPFFALSLAFGLVGIHFVDMAQGFQDTGYSLGTRIWFGPYSLMMYVVRFFAPFGLATYYPYPPKDMTLPAMYYLSPLVVAAMAYGVWRSTYRSKAVAFGVAFFLVNIAFVLQIKGAGKAFLADRFTYIPYIGFCFIIAKYYNEYTQNGGLKTILPAVAITFVAMLSVLTVMQNATWKTSVALWENVNAKFPDDALGYTNKGLAYDETQDYPNAITAYSEALRVNPQYYDAAYNRAVAYFNTKQYEKAAADYSAAIQINPEKPESYGSRALAYTNLNLMDKAIADYNKVLALHELDKDKDKKSVDPETLRNLAAAYAATNQFDKAIAGYDAAIKLKPKADYYYMKGNAFAAMQKYEDAMAQYDQAMTMQKDYVDAINNKANCLSALKRFKESVPLYDQAIALNGTAPNYYANRGLAKNSLGDKNGACADWTKALQMGYAQAQNLLNQYCR